MTTNLHRESARALAAALIAVVSAACTTTTRSDVPTAPSALAVPPGLSLTVTAHASGAQIYACKSVKDDPTRFDWALVAPDAELRDRAGKLIGKHYAGPTWESTDGSKVVGAVAARDPGPDTSAIPWLLLNAASTTGHGIFEHVRAIQRLHTVGGKAPTGGCDAGRSDQNTRVPYTADYYFYAEAR